MFKEPVPRGPAFLIRYFKDTVARDLMLVLHDARLNPLTEITRAIREISTRYPDWKASTASIQDAALPGHEIPDLDASCFYFDIRYFYSVSSENRIIVHRALLDRIIKRLLSDIPGTDFIQRSGIARGLRYFDRPEARQLLLKEAVTNRWLLLEAVRRFGKTSLMVNMEDRQPEDAIVIYVSLESGSSEGFLAHALVAHAMRNPRMATLVPSKLQSGVKADLSVNELFDRLMVSGRDPRKDLEALWKSVSKSDVPILFMLDELVIYLNNVLNSMPRRDEQELESWRKWVREIFHMLDDAPGCVRFVLAGSMHLPVYLEAREVHLGLLEEMRYIPLSPVPQEDIKTLLRLSLLQEGVVAEEGEIEWIVERFGGWIPSFLIYFVGLLGIECRDRGVLDLPGIKSCYGSLFDAKHKDIFSDLDEQPRRYQELFNPSLHFTLRLQCMLVKAATECVNNFETPPA